MIHFYETPCNNIDHGNDGDDPSSDKAKLDNWGSEEDDRKINPSSLVGITLHIALGEIIITG